MRCGKSKNKVEESLGRNRKGGKIIKEVENSEKRQGEKGRQGLESRIKK